jgi:hypothetical protein
MGLLLTNALFTMTIISTANTTVDTTSAIVAEFAGGQSSDIAMMIGIGLVKDSEAVFFQYIGDEQTPSALMLPSGKPLTRLANVRLVGCSIAEEVGEFKATKLNIFLETTQGRQVMLTSGLTTIWSQCAVTGLMELLKTDSLIEPFTLDTWKGNSKMRPCFAAVRTFGQKRSNDETYNALVDARTDRDTKKVNDIMRDAVECLSLAVGSDSIAPLEVKVEENAEF